MEAKKEDRNRILELFIDSFKGDSKFQFIEGINPCVIKYDGEIIDVYIKNLTPAQLSNNNPNVCRIQLPQKKCFDKIKESSNFFLLLGYDTDCDVFATWNPYWTKQRLNVGKSVSLYSRLNLQEEACLEAKFIEYELNHNGKVVLFPRELLGEYIQRRKDFFPEETTYIAIGSSIEKSKRENIIQELKFSLEDIECQPNKSIKPDCKQHSKYPIITDENIRFRIFELMSQTPPQSLKAMEILFDHLGDKMSEDISLKEWFYYIEHTDWNVTIETNETANVYRNTSKDETVRMVAEEPVDAIEFISEDLRDGCIETNVDVFAKMFENINVSIIKGMYSPHKFVLLSALVSLFKKEYYNSNLIKLDEQLEAEYKMIWQNKIGNHPYFKCSIDKPFYYLKSEPFWELKKKVEWEKKTNYNANDLKKYYEGAVLDPYLYKYLQNREDRNKLIDSLQRFYLDHLQYYV